jgi:hypothetical protein
VSAGEERLGHSLIEDVRRFGLLSADTVVDRYARLVDRAIDGETLAAPRPDGALGGPEGLDGPDTGGLAEGTARLATAWLHLLEATARLADRAAGTATPVGRLELPPTGPGLAAEGAIWVHNTTTSATPVELVVTTLAGPGGLVVPADAVSFAPVRVDPVPARASAEIRVYVRVPDGQGPGRYQGLILTPAAEEPVLLRLDVRAAGDAGP